VRLLHGARYLAISDIIFPKRRNEGTNVSANEFIGRAGQSEAYRDLSSLPQLSVYASEPSPLRVESRRISMHGGFRYPISSERGRYISAFRRRAAKVYGEFLD